MKEEVTLIEIPVSDKIAGKQVHELNLPHNVLITTQVHNGKSQTVNVQPECISEI